MKTKKELEKQLNATNELITNYRNEAYADSNKIKELQSKCDELENRKDRILNECNLRANFIKHILKIVLGEAKPISKFEVIRDMFLPQIKELEDGEDPRRNKHYNHLRTIFLSDELNDREIGIFLNERKNL